MPTKNTPIDILSPTEIAQTIFTEALRSPDPSDTDATDKHHLRIFFLLTELANSITNDAIGKEISGGDQQVPYLRLFFNNALSKQNDENKQKILALIESILESQTLHLMEQGPRSHIFTGIASLAEKPFDSTELAEQGELPQPPSLIKWDQAQIDKNIATLQDNIKNLDSDNKAFEFQTGTLEIADNAVIETLNKEAKNIAKSFFDNTIFKQINLPTSFNSSDFSFQEATFTDCSLTSEQYISLKIKGVKFEGKTTLLDKNSDNCKLSKNLGTTLQSKITQIAKTLAKNRLEEGYQLIYEFGKYIQSEFKKIFNKNKLDAPLINSILKEVYPELTILNPESLAKNLDILREADINIDRTIKDTHAQRPFNRKISPILSGFHHGLECFSSLALSSYERGSASNFNTDFFKKYSGDPDENERIAGEFKTNFYYFQNKTNKPLFEKDELQSIDLSCYNFKDFDFTEFDLSNASFSNTNLENALISHFSSQPEKNTSFIDCDVTGVVADHLRVNFNGEIIQLHTPTFVAAFKTYYPSKPKTEFIESLSMREAFTGEDLLSTFKEAQENPDGPSKQALETTLLTTLFNQNKAAYQRCYSLESFIHHFSKEYNRLEGKNSALKTISKHSLSTDEKLAKIQATLGEDKAALHAFQLAFYKAERHRVLDNDYLVNLEKTFKINEVKNRNTLPSGKDFITQENLTPDYSDDARAFKTIKTELLANINRAPNTISDFFRKADSYFVKKDSESICFSDFFFNRTHESYISLLRNAKLPEDKIALIEKLDTVQNWDTKTIQERKDDLRIEGGTIAETVLTTKEERNKLIKALLRSFFIDLYGSAISNIVDAYMEKHNQFFLSTSADALELIPKVLELNDHERMGTYPLQLKGPSGHNDLNSSIKMISVKDNILIFEITGPVTILDISCQKSLTNCGDTTGRVIFQKDINGEYRATDITITYTNRKLEALIKGPTPALQYGIHRELIEDARTEENATDIDACLLALDNEIAYRVNQRTILSGLNLRKLKLNDYILSDKNFSGSDLSDTDFTDSDLDRSVLDNSVINDNTKISLAQLKSAQWNQLRYQIQDAENNALVEIKIDRKQFKKYFTPGMSAQEEQEAKQKLLMACYQTQLAETLRVCRDDEKEALLANYRKACEKYKVPCDFSSFELSGNFQLTLKSTDKLPGEFSDFNGTLSYEYVGGTPIQIPSLNPTLLKALDHGKNPEEKAIIYKGIMYQVLHAKLSGQNTITASELSMLLKVAKEANVSEHDAKQGLKFPTPPKPAATAPTQNTTTHVQNRNAFFAEARRRIEAHQKKPAEEIEYRKMYGFK